MVFRTYCASACRNVVIRTMVSSKSGALFRNSNTSIYATNRNYQNHSCMGSWMDSGNCHPINAFVKSNKPYPI